MPNDGSINAEIGLNSKEFKSGMTGVNRELKLLQTEFKATQAGIENANDSMEGMKNKSKYLASSIETQKNKLAILSEEHRKAVELYGENSAAAQNLQIKMNRTTEQINKMDLELRQTENSIEILNNSVEGLENNINSLNSEISQNESHLSDLRGEYARVAREQGETSDAAQELQQEINQTSNNLNDLQQELNQTSTRLEEMEIAANEANENLDEMANGTEKSGSGLLNLIGVADIAKISVGTALVGAFAAAIGAIVAFGAKSVMAADDFKRSMNKLINQTGATKKEMQELEIVMKNLYKKNLGEDWEDLANSVGVVKRSISALKISSSKDLEITTKKALLLRDTFEFEIDESINAAISLINTFGIDSNQAFELITQGAQQGLNKNQDMLDILREYSPQFESMGFSAEQMLNVLKSGIDDGVWSLDIFSDGLKEFNIRAIDMSKTSVEAFEKLGLNAEEMSKKFAKGGKDANKAFFEVINGIKKIEDPIEKNSVAVGLFGTKFEDLEVSVLDSFSNIENTIDISKNKMEDLNEIRFDSLGDGIKGIWRIIEVELMIPVGEQLIPVLQNIGKVTKKSIEEFKDDINIVNEKIENFINLFYEGDFETIKEKLMSILPDQFGPYIDTLVQYWDLLRQSFIDIQPDLDRLKDNINDLMENNLNLLLIGVQIFLENWEDIWENFGPIMLDGIEIVIESFENLLELFNHFIEFHNSLVGGDIGNAWESYSDFVKKANVMIIETLLNIMKIQVDIFDTIKDSAAEKLEKLREVIINKLQELQKNAPENIEALKIKIIKKINNLSIEFTKKGIGMINSFLDNFFGNKNSNKPSENTDVAMKKVKNKIEEKKPGIVSAIFKLVTDITVELAKLAIKSTPHIVSFMYSISNTIASRIPFILGIISAKLVSAIISKLENLASSAGEKAYEIGTNIYKGIGNGIKAGFTWVKDKAAGLAKAAIKAAKNALKEKSPSRVFFEIGENVVEGFVLGIDKRESKAIREIRSVMQNIVKDSIEKTFKNTSSNVEKYFDEIKENILESLEDLSDSAINELNDLYKSTEKALKKQYDAQKKYSNKLLDEESQIEIKKRQDKIDALNKEKEMEEKQAKDKEFRDKYNAMVTEMIEAETGEEKLKIKGEIDSLLLEKQKEQEEEKRKLKIEELETEIDNIEKANKEKKDKIDEYFDELQEDENLYQEAKRIMMGKYQDQLINLLAAYNSKYQNAGQTFAEYFIDGWNSQKKNISNAVSDTLNQIDLVNSFDLSTIDKSLAKYNKEFTKSIQTMKKNADKWNALENSKKNKSKSAINKISSQQSSLSKSNQEIGKSIGLTYDKGKWYLPSGELAWMADGGIVNTKKIVGVGEQGPEAIIPLDKITPLFIAALAQADKTINNVTNIVNNNNNNNSAGNQELKIENKLYLDSEIVYKKVTKKRLSTQESRFRSLGLT